MVSTNNSITNSSGVSGNVSKCSNCNEIVRLGELICPKCGTILASNTSASTKALPKAEETFPRRTSIGSIPRYYQKVTLIIDGKQAALPAAQHLIIGRHDSQSDAPPPDIDLTPFGAAELGVSRQHIELAWKNDLIFIVDVGSTNGTLLNGQRLMAGIERILRDNDELIIGHMPVRVRFIDN